MDTPDLGAVHFDLAAADAGQPLRAIVQHALGEQGNAEQLLAHGGVWVGTARMLDGGTTPPAGTHITIHTPPGGVYRTVALRPAQIIYEDADLIALDKPPDAYTGAVPWDIMGNMQAALHTLLAQRDGSAPTLHPAHRLDRDTSGVLLFSVNPAVNRGLQNAFATKKVHKQYLALCAGVLAADAFEVETGHGRTINGHFHTYPLEHVGQMLLNGGVVKHMHTRFTVLHRFDDATLLRAEPITGRTHQIRLHMAFVGHALLGDAKYGGPAMWRGETLPHHLLHAAQLAMPHPRTRQPLVLRAPPPAWANVTKNDR